MVTPTQIKLVQASFVHCLPIPDEVAATFYRRLFEAAPSTRRLFKADLNEQGRKLVMTLAAVVDGLDRLDQLVPVAQELARRHAAYGVNDGHYPVVGMCLIETLRELLGPLFVAEIEAAWAAAYTMLADTMISATRRAA